MPLAGADLKERLKDSVLNTFADFNFFPAIFFVNNSDVHVILILQNMQLISIYCVLPCILIIHKKLRIQ
jgi:hypothetical protein